MPIILAYQGCDLAEPGVPWRLTFVFAWSRNIGFSGQETFFSIHLSLRTSVMCILLVRTTKLLVPIKSATAIQGLKNSLFISTMSQLSEKLKSKKKRKFIFKSLSYKIRKKMIYYLSKVMQRQSSATYLSNRTTWITFLLVRMEKLPVSDVRTGQVSCPVFSINLYAEHPGFQGFRDSQLLFLEHSLA